MVEDLGKVKERHNLGKETIAEIDGLSVDLAELAKAIKDNDYTGRSITLAGIVEKCLI